MESGISNSGRRGEDDDEVRCVTERITSDDDAEVVEAGGGVLDGVFRLTYVGRIRS